VKMTTIVSPTYTKVNEVAFVTAYLDIYQDESIDLTRNRGIEWRLKTFQPLAYTGIPIYLFYSHKYAPFFETQEFQQRNPNVILFRKMELEQTWTWKITQTHQPLQLPKERNDKKDTYEYMVLQNAKQEFIQQVIEKFPQHTHYAWIDFSIVHMFKEPKQSLEYLRICYGTRSIPRVKQTQEPDPSPFFIPGCWPQQWFEPDLDAILERIHWRFCGSFFIASQESMVNFNRLYRHCFPLFLKEHKRMIWEVNFWAWLEVTNKTLLEKYPALSPTDIPIQSWKPTWYHSDHNDTIYRAPYWPFISQPLIQYFETQIQPLQLATNLPQEKYPKEGREWIGSSGFTYSPTYGPLLNTRVMNYWLYPNGYYRFTETKHIIRSRNLLSTLNEEGQPIQTYEVEEKFGINILQHHKPDAFSQGLEDIRLWVSPANTAKGRPEILRFIATNVNYSPRSKVRMITGTLDITQDENTQEWKPIFTHALGLEPPTDTYAEKNWIPLVLTETKDSEPTEHFIYKWSPFELGKIHYPSYSEEYANESNLPRPQLDIHTVVRSRNPFLFQRMRGSSPFIPFPSPSISSVFTKLATEEWLGVAHFSDEGSPRSYSHVLISLDKKGIPVRYSAPFTFCKVGVEFCIGFHSFEKEQETYLRFWISRHDRDTSILTTPFRHIPLEYFYREDASESSEPSETITIQNSELKVQEPISNQPILQSFTNPPVTPIHLFILCYNEELLLPHTLKHYRTQLPHAYITVYDNESSDRSREIAEEWGCRVVLWNSNNEQNEYIQQNIKNDVWKASTPFKEIQIDPRPECSGRGWKIVVDMDEWLVITEQDLVEEEAKGTSILRFKGVNVIGQSQSETVEDISPQEFHQWNRVVDWAPENKNICFLAPPITNMNYTRGAHGCKPEGERVQYSKKIYYNKHMEILGLPFFIRKFTLRKQRNSSMQQREVNLHYTDDISQLTERYQTMFQNSYLLEHFQPIDDDNYVLEVNRYYT